MVKLAVILFLVLFVCKVASVGMGAAASWWIVTSPLWGGVLLGIVLTALAALVGWLGSLLAKRKMREFCDKRDAARTRARR